MLIFINTICHKIRAFRINLSTKQCNRYKERSRQFDPDYRFRLLNKNYVPYRCKGSRIGIVYHNNQPVNLFEPKCKKCRFFRDSRRRFIGDLAKTILVGVAVRRICK